MRTISPTIRTVSTILVLVLCWTATWAAPPAGPVFRQIGHNVDAFGDAGTGQIAVADVDHDGTDDLVFGAVATNPILFVVGKTASGSLGFKQALVRPVSDGPSFNNFYARVLAWRRGPGTQIVTVTRNGKAEIFGDWPLTEQRSFSIANDAVAAAIGDVNHDQADELLVLTSLTLTAYDLGSGTKEWSLSMNDGTDVAVAQLDNDPALEVIVAGTTPGQVIDGATLATDWSYIDGFGTQLATGTFLASGEPRWVGYGSNDAFTVFGANPWSPRWDYPTVSNYGVIASGDIDGSGIDSILYSYGGVRVVDPATQQERLTIPYAGYAIEAIAVADFNGDGLPDIAFTGNPYPDDVPTIVVADATSDQILWQYVRSGQSRVTAVGDVDGDGRDEVVNASSGHIYILDFQTGAREWRSPNSTGNNDPFEIQASRIALVPHVNRPGMDIVLAGTQDQYGHFGKIVVIDGATRSLVRQIGYWQSPILSSRAITGLAIMDYDEDGADDYVVATQPTDSGASGAKLHVFSGASGALLWQSVALGSGSQPINDVVLIPPRTAGGATELVAVLPTNLRAFNSQTQLLDWILFADCDEAAYVDAGLSGPELMLYQRDGTVAFHDAQTRDFLRSITLESPAGGVVPLQGDVRILLVAADQSVQLVDGRDGAVLADETLVGNVFDLRRHLPTLPAATPFGPTSWHISVSTEPALWRLRLDASDRIFIGTFELP